VTPPLDTTTEADAVRPAAPSASGASAAPAGPVVRKRRGYFLPGTIALIALLGLGLFVGAGDLQHRAPTVLHGPDLAGQIALAVQAQQGSRSTPTVTCPPTEPVRQGLTFQCRLAGHPDRTLVVTEVDGRGRISWAFRP